MIPFSFQKGNKVAGCEDAPPIADSKYTVVCDGLGGAGASKHTVLEEESGKHITRTSAYLGSRIVCECVNAYYEQNIFELLTMLRTQDKAFAINGFLSGLKNQISSVFEMKMQKWGITPSQKRALKDFPTTLASAIYMPLGKVTVVLAIWAGDSRVYVLMPQKGLQLLSLDDAKNAEIEMNSASEMTNCISASNMYRLNYAVYELKGPGIVFCCSDGCFDFIQSPLHFEWLLLHTILEYMPNSCGEDLGTKFADCVRDNMYKTIGDDTTMAGIIVGMDSSLQMKTFYQGRMTESGELAVSMNEQLKELKKLQSERDTAKKTCRLLEEKVISSIHEEVCIALKSSNANSMLQSRLMAMPCYSVYMQKVNKIEKEIEDECRSEMRKMQEISYQTKNVCRNMLICDFLKWQRQMDDQRSGSALWGQLSMRLQETTGLTQSNQAYTNPMRAKQYFLTCIEMYNHPYFKEIVDLPVLPDDEIEKYIQLQTGLLKKLIVLLDNSDLLFGNLWSQAYFLTELFAKDRNQCDRSDQFEGQFKQAMSNPHNCQFVSNLSARKIAEYNDREKDIDKKRERLLKKKQTLQENISEEFWIDYKDDILEWIMYESEVNIRTLFANTTVSIDRLISYIQAKKSLTMINQKIEMAQSAVDKIWQFYKGNYQLFSQITEKGVC